MDKKFIIISVLAVAVIAANATGGVWLWKHFTADTQRQQTQISHLSTQLGQQQAALTALQSNVSQLNRSQQQNSVQQALSEVAYLLSLTNLYLQINHDTVNARKSLQLAKHQVQALADPTLLPLQQALASDLNRLNDAAQTDVAELLLQLQALAESISQLNLLTPPTAEISPVTPDSAQPPQPWYQQWLQTLWKNFKSLLVIRYHSPGAPILPPEQREWIRENIAFTLAQAQWAALQQKSNLYQTSLAQVQQWLTLYFPDTPQRNKALQRLATLTAINIAPKLPNINASLRALQQVLQELPNPSTSPVATAPAKSSAIPLPPTRQMPKSQQPSEPPSPAAVEV